MAITDFAVDDRTERGVGHLSPSLSLHLAYCVGDLVGIARCRTECVVNLAAVGAIDPSLSKSDGLARALVVLAIRVPAVLSVAEQLVFLRGAFALCHADAPTRTKARRRRRAQPTV